VQRKALSGHLVELLQFCSILEKIEKKEEMMMFLPSGIDKGFRMSITLLLSKPSTNNNNPESTTQ
jgi:hypothetical protein